MQETTSTEFLAWQQYFEQEQTKHTREHYYLAQIAAEVRRSNVKNPKAVTPEQLLLKFTTSPKKVAPPTEADREARTAASKANWFGLVGTPPPKPGG